MRRVLVPLDGTPLAEAILPDARRMAGPGGEIVLINDAKLAPYYGIAYAEDQRRVITVTREYLHDVAKRLEADGVAVRAFPMVVGDAATAIDEAASIFEADMVAVATHGRSPLGRLFRGSVAWKALANSPVPVLLRHIDRDELTLHVPHENRILVPLDGSTLAERALPLAQELAKERGAEIWLTQVVYTMATPAGKGVMPVSPTYYPEIEPKEREARAYLSEVAASLEGSVHTHVLLGAPVEDLVAAAETWLVSDIVIASHGRTGLSRVILGSVADALVHRLNVPIIVVPALARQPQHEAATAKRAPEAAATR